ncbi:chalcone isomerase family protein [Methylophaga sp.]|uniref:chalcone isomerase family protein n=1 Tax=Methylophaga sp. TaxID=2024840 RepID=UPI003A950A5F
MLKFLVAMITMSVCTTLLADVRFQDTVKTTSSTLQKCNETSITVMAFVDVADAAFYLPDCNFLPDIAGEKQLSFYYHRSITADDFIEASETLLERNLTSTEYSKIEDELTRFNANYQDVEDGDVYDIRKTKSGLYLLKNGQQISHSSSIELTNFYYQIWFGPKPFNKGMKETLLER